MKTKILTLCLALTVLMSGCLVKSIHPFYTDADLVFNKDLVGNWQSEDHSTWVISQSSSFPGFGKPVKDEKCYKIVQTQENGGKAVFLAHLFKLNNQLYLDFIPDDVPTENTLLSYHVVAMHTFAKVDLKDGKISINWYNENWLTDLFNQNKIRIAHERQGYIGGNTTSKDDKSQIILTASTADLQKFIIKYSNDPKAFTTDEKGKKDFSFTLIRTQK